MSFETHLGRIDKRNWGDIKGNWYNHLTLIDPPGIAPLYEIYESTLLQEEVGNVKDTGEYHCDLYELKKDVLREGIFLLHKAVNVIGVTNNNCNNGFLSWSNSSAYQSSFFALKSIFCFCGLSFPKINGIDYLIDIWARPEPLSKNQIKKGYEPIQRTKILRFKSLNHYHYWRIFQRLLDVSQVDIWNENVVEYLKSLDPLDFGKQRNNLHYRNNYWLLNDLFDNIFDKNFPITKVTEGCFNEINTSTKNFSLWNCKLIFLMAFQLLNDIKTNAPILNNEVEILLKSIGNFNCETYIDI